MNLLKRLPLQYKGELHDVRLINFSVEKEEVADQVPANMKIREFDGRAMISMVDVKLKNMRPTVFPFLRFHYRHIAFRLLIDDSDRNNGIAKGIFFFRSFTDNPFIVYGGQLTTDYNLEMAKIIDNRNEVTIAQANHCVKYCLDETEGPQLPQLKTAIGALDRAYSILGDTLRVTTIQREKWPIEIVNCKQFENTFFKTARFEGAFRVFETIYYDWFPPKAVA